MTHEYSTQLHDPNYDPSYEPTATVIAHLRDENRQLKVALANEEARGEMFVAALVVIAVAALFAGVMLGVLHPWTLLFR